MTDTKRVDELEVGDVVIFPHRKEHRTISIIKPPSSLNNKLYVIHTEETQNTVAYIGHEKVTYLGNKKKEETMTAQKVDCSALYPYFDSLASEETTLKHTNIPVYVKQQLKNIHELFEDILGLTLEEVKALYFERKMSSSNVVEKVDYYVTKKAKELCIGDKLVLSAPIKIVEITGLKKVIPNHIRFEWEDSYRTYLEDVLVDILKE